MREFGPGVDRRYRWDALGNLAQAGDTRVSVDALGELAEVGGEQLLWDTEDPFSPLAWFGDHAVPFARAGDDVPRDPFGAPLGPVDPAPHLGYRGELEFEGLTWLRARAYDPATRSFLSPDPLPPVPGTPYAGNAVPLRRQRPDRPAWTRSAGARSPSRSCARSATGWARTSSQRNADTIIAGALIVGGIAVMATGVGGPLGAAMIGGALLSAGSSAAIQKVTTGHVDYKQVAIAGAIGGAAGGLGYGAGALVSGTLEGGGDRPRRAGRRRREHVGGRGEPRRHRRRPVRSHRDGHRTCCSAAASARSAAGSAPARSPRTPTRRHGSRSAPTRSTTCSSPTDRDQAAHDGGAGHAGGHRRVRRRRQARPLAGAARRGRATSAATHVKMPGEHAEVTVITSAKDLGLTPRDIGVSRDICPDCQQAITTRAARSPGRARAVAGSDEAL